MGLTVNRGVARIFQGGVTLGHANNIVMAFSPRNIVGCLLKKKLTKGGSRAPQDPPSYAPGQTVKKTINRQKWKILTVNRQLNQAKLAVKGLEYADEAQ